MRIDLQELSDMRQKYRRETEVLRTEIDDLLPSRPPTPLFRPIRIEESDLSVGVHEIVKEVVHSMAETMENDIKADADVTKKFMVQYTLRVLEKSHLVIEQELMKFREEALEEGEIDDRFNLDLLRFD